MTQLFLTGLVAFGLTFLSIPAIIQIAESRQLFDIPDERKQHRHSITSLGGVSLFLGIIFTCLLQISFHSNPEFQFLLAAITLMFFTGLRDDIIELPPFKKFVIQILAAGIIIHLGGIQITNLDALLGINGLSPFLEVPFTYIMIILVVNAYNLIDGIDGLSGSLGLMASLFLGAYFYLAGIEAYALMSFAVAAALLAFLIFNFHPAKIFMGDSGALTIGLILSVLVLKFINSSSNPSAVIPFSSAFAIGISVLLVPLVDTIRVFAIRILKGRSPFAPDRNHIHHILLDRGYSHSSIVLICVAVNVIVVTTVYFMQGVNSIIILSAIFAVAFLLVGALYASKSARTPVVQHQSVSNSSANRTPSKVIDLNTKQYTRDKNSGV